MGLNEFAGTSRWRQARWRRAGSPPDGLRPQPFYLGIVFVMWIDLSVLLVRETHHTCPSSRAPRRTGDVPSGGVFWRTT